jgi:hypothetical protein
LKVMPAPNVYDKSFCVLSHQSVNVLTTPHIMLMISASFYAIAYTFSFSL